MRTLDWIVLVTSLVSIVAYGLYRSRGSDTVDRYLLAGSAMPWYAMGLSIMATQASAITFISTTGQSYVDGMRFVQFYFGLPIAMIVITRDGGADVPSRQSLHGIRISGETIRRQDAGAGQHHFSDPARALGGADDLRAGAWCSRVILGWPERITTCIMGVLVIMYTALGGIKAVTWSDVQQMCIIFLGLLLVADHGDRAAAARMCRFGDAVFLAGAAGKLNAVDYARSTGTTGSTSGAACWAERFCSWPISAATSRRCSAI